MMKTCVFASFLATAAAFAPAAQNSHATTTALSAKMMTMDDLPGSINFARQPLKWDPLNLSTTYQPFLPWFREAELRHGRTAMLAVLGFIVPDFVRLPGAVYSFENVPKGVNAHDTLVAMGVASPMFQLLVFIGLWEVIVALPGAIAMFSGDRAPGDYGMAAYVERNPKYADKVAYHVDSELLNGRLAMMAVGGIATQNIITGHGFPFV